MKRETREEGELSSGVAAVEEQRPNRRPTTPTFIDRSFGWLEDRHTSHNESRSEYWPAEHRQSDTPFNWSGSYGDSRRFGQRTNAPRRVTENNYENFLRTHQEHGPPAHASWWLKASGRVSTPRAHETPRRTDHGREQSAEGGGNKMRFQRPLPMPTN